MGLRVIPVELFSTTQHSIAVPGHSCPCCINAFGNPKSDAASEFEFTTHHEVPWADRVQGQLDRRTLGNWWGTEAMN